MNNIITIVTPSFNHEKYIKDTIESVLSQSGDFYLDYIVADGGSTDKTVEILKHYENLIKNNQYPVKCKGIEFRFWSHKDKGQTDAINQGFEISKGNILGYLNSDDLYISGALQKVCEVFNNDIDLVYGKCISFYDNQPSRIIKNIPPSKIDFKLLQKKGPKIFQPSSFWSRRIYQMVGSLEVDLHYAMDYEYFLRILKKGRAIFVNEFLSRFRVVNNQKSAYLDKILNEFLLVNKKYNDGRITFYYLKTKFKSLFY